MKKATKFLKVLAIFILISTSIFVVNPAHAAGIIVNTDADDTFGNDGFCTLREAITNANSDIDTTNGDCAAGSGADTITFLGNYTVTLSGTQLPLIPSGSIVTITGNGPIHTI